MKLLKKVKEVTELEENETNITQKTLGVSFSGGGVKSWALIAALEELEKKNIEITAATGTSMGSFIAAGVASGLSAKDIYKIVQEADAAIEESKLFDRHAFLNMFSLRQPMGLVLMEKLEEVIKPALDQENSLMLSDVPKPLAIPAVDIISKRLIVFSNQPLFFDKIFENAIFYDKDIPLLDACLASSAYPIMLSPVEIDEYQLVDGGVLLNSPSALFSKNKIEYVLQLGLESSEYEGPAQKRMDVAMRSIDIMIEDQIIRTTSNADKIYLMDLELPDTFDFGDSSRIIEAGPQFVREYPIETRDIFKKTKVPDNVKIIVEEPLTWKERLEGAFGRLRDTFR
jgi:NTE family protein